MVGVGGSVLMGAMVYGREIYNFWKPRRIGIYGPKLVGKTTLDRYMTTPGEMEEVEERTKHPERLLKSGFILPKAKRKRIVWEGQKRVIHSADLGGEQRFWNLWLEDMVDRRVEIAIFMTDQRAGEGNGAEKIDCVGGFQFLAESIIERNWRYRRIRTRLRGKKYSPKLILLVANKADTWWDEDANKLWQAKRLREHRVFNPHRETMVQLQKAGVPCRVSMMATRIGWNVEQTLIDMLGWL